MEAGADEGQQRNDNTNDTVVTGTDQETPQQNTTVQQDTYTSTGAAPLDIQLQMEQQLIMGHWLLGALMFIAGILAVIAFFVARGESHG